MHGRLLPERGETRVTSSYAAHWVMIDEPILYARAGLLFGIARFTARKTAFGTSQYTAEPVSSKLLRNGECAAEHHYRCDKADSRSFGLAHDNLHWARVPAKLLPNTH